MKRQPATLINREEAIKYLIKKYSKREGNVLFLDRLFIVNAALNWLSRQTTNQQVLRIYVDDLEKYIEGIIELDLIA